MEINEIKILLGKYKEGLTSLEEEKVLKDYFLRHQVPEELMAYKEYFHLLTQESAAVPNSFGLEEKLSVWVDAQDKGNLHSKQKVLWLKLTGIAAGIAMLIVSYIGYNQYHQRKLSKDTYKDPQLAYAEVKRTLLYISQQLNRGTAPLSSVSKMNDGMVGMSAFSSFGSGLKELELVSKYYDNNNSENSNTK